MAKNKLLGVWVDEDLKKQIKTYVRAYSRRTPGRKVRKDAPDTPADEIGEGDDQELRQRYLDVRYQNHTC